MGDNLMRAEWITAVSTVCGAAVAFVIFVRTNLKMVFEFDCRKEMSFLFDNINLIQIMGGEPFLNQEVDKYCRLIRDIFPYSKIEIVTNGTILLNVNPSIWHNTLEKFQVRG